MKKLLALLAIVLALAMFAGIGLGIIAQLPTDFNKADYEVVSYKVKSGDTLWALASAYCMPDDDVNEWITMVCRYNDIDNPNRIYAGQLITIYARK